MTLGPTSRPLTIAIDGPAGAGKSTVAKLVARRLGYLYIDTGAMYRALAYKALQEGVSPSDQERLDAMAVTSQVELLRQPQGVRVLLDGQDVTREIRTPEVSRIVSKVSSSPGLRRRMVELQRQMGGQGGIVMDGRDIGSVVLPTADRKFFVTASLAERARRRAGQLSAQGHAVDLAALEEEIHQRDLQDENKGESSLRRVPDAIFVDTTGSTVDEVVEIILSYCRGESS